jgi:hypothetical protein
VYNREMSNKELPGPPAFEWKEGDTIALYCHTHKAWIFRGNASTPIGLRVFVSRFHEHKALWGDWQEHDMSFSHPSEKARKQMTSQKAMLVTETRYKFKQARRN